MNMGFWVCIVVAIPVFLIGVFFAVRKGNAAKWVAGFNSLSRREQELYDKAGIVRDVRDQCFLWSGVMLAGAVLSWLITPYMAIAAYLIWLVLLFKDIQFDVHKAYEKYRIK